MPTDNIGFLGFGAMASAMARGFSRGERPPRMFACARRFPALRERAAGFGVIPCQSPKELVAQSSLVVAAVKPHLMEEVLAPLRESLRGKVLLSVASGWDFARLEALLGPEVRHISCMPNTPVAVGEGVILLEERHSLRPEEREGLEALLAPLGLVETLPGTWKEVAGVITGCGPAWAAMFLEALADGAVSYGLPRETAYRLAAQMLAGTGKLQLETGQHPAAMKDAVCSPGGTTIAGVKALEQAGFRAAALAAVDGVMRKKEG